MKRCIECQALIPDKSEAKCQACTTREPETPRVFSGFERDCILYAALSDLIENKLDGHLDDAEIPDEPAAILEKFQEKFHPLLEEMSLPIALELLREVSARLVVSANAAAPLVEKAMGEEKR